MSAGIDAKYQQLGGSNGPLGAPTGSEIELNTNDIPCPDPYKGLIRYYEHGAIFAYEGIGTFAVCDAVYGPVFYKWQLLKREGIDNGLPVRGNTSEIIGDSDITGERYEYAIFVKGWVCFGSSCGAHGVHDDFCRKWRDNLSLLGYPVRTTRPTQDGKGRESQFESGSIYKHPDTPVCIVPNGSIQNKWVSLGGATGWVGYPITDEREINPAGARACAFQGASIFSFPGIEAHEIHGWIRGKWQKLSSDTNLWLGVPLCDETPTPDGVGRYNHFQNGSIYWHPQTGAFEIHGAINSKWASLGRERSFLGYPVTDETKTPDGVGRFNHFQGGSIYWHPDAGAFEVHGAINNKWASFGKEQSFLGYPVTDETKTPDGVGRFNHFQGGSIYCHPSTGAHEVHGSIRAKWSELGWERSYLGYPITDESAANSGNRRYSLFQGGCIHWSPNSGSVDLALGLRRPFKSLSPAIKERKVLAILWDPQNPDCPPAISKDAVASAVFGEVNSVRDLLREQSSSAFELKNAGVLGWYPADKPAEHYWNHPAGSDEWVSGHVEKWTEAIRKADKEFDFRVFDTDPTNRTTDPNELGILILIASRGTDGFVRPPYGRELPTREPLVVDGVRIPLIAEVYHYSGSPPDIPTVAHELMHLLFDVGDMYFTWFMPYAAGAYSLMDCGIHLDPFHKLKLGWVRPRMITQTGRYTLPDVETRNTIWLLVDPRRGIDEYYLVENRWPGNSYEKNLPDRGLAVWHIMEDPAVYGVLPAPPGVSQANWDSVPKDEFSRRGIRMIRPVIGPPFDDRTALWDGSDPLTGYDLSSHDPDPAHAGLRWANGSPSGFAIREISAPGPEMSAKIEVPW